MSNEEAAKVRRTLHMRFTLPNADSGQFAAMGNTIYGPNQTPFVARGIDIMQGQDPSLADVQSAAHSETMYWCIGQLHDAVLSK